MLSAIGANPRAIHAVGIERHCDMPAGIHRDGAAISPIVGISLFTTCVAASARDWCNRVTRMHTECAATVRM